MTLFCRLCGDRHAPDFCPDFGPIPPPKPPLYGGIERAPSPMAAEPATELSNENIRQDPDRKTKEKRPVVEPSAQRREIFPTTGKFLPQEGRPFLPQDMKQEWLPPKQKFKAVRPRFNKVAYQRILMQKRRAARKEALNAR